MLGATGTIGLATTQALIERGHNVVCFLRPGSWVGAHETENSTCVHHPRSYHRCVDVSDLDSVRLDGFCGEQFDAIISCMASRTGAPDDAWAIDYQAHKNVLTIALEHQVPHMVLLSAICVQKPRLAFQYAKLAFEDALIGSGITYSIVRPTAYFKSLSGQLDRVRQGKPFLVFGDGRQTACKPISDKDLASYLVDCLERRDRYNRVLPVGGPGNALTPQEQGEYLFSLLKRPARIRHVPLAFIDAAVASLNVLSRIAPCLSSKSELARIGRYYATESMLLLNPETGQYDADATPSTGTETLFDFYAQALRENRSVDRGDHAIF